MSDIDYSPENMNAEERKELEYNLIKNYLKTKEIEPIYQYSKILAIEHRLEELGDMLELMEILDSNYKDTPGARKMLRKKLDRRPMRIYG